MADTRYLTAGFLLLAALCAAIGYLRSLDHRRVAGSIEPGPRVLIAGLVAAALVSLPLAGIEGPAIATFALASIGLIGVGLTGLALRAGTYGEAGQPGNGPSWRTIRLVAWSAVPAIVTLTVAVGALVVQMTTAGIDPHRATEAIEALTWLAMPVLVVAGAQSVGRSAARTRWTIGIGSLAVLGGWVLAVAANVSPWATAGSVATILVGAVAGLAPRVHVEEAPRRPPTMVDALALGLPAILLIGGLMMAVAVAVIPAG